MTKSASKSTPKRRPRARYSPADVARLKRQVLAGIAGGLKRKPLSIASAADVARVPVRTVHEWRRDDPSFNAAVTEAKAAGAERLEDHVLRKADRLSRKTWRVEKGRKRLWQVEEREDLHGDLTILGRRSPVPQAVELSGPQQGPIQTETKDVSDLEIGRSITSVLVDGLAAKARVAQALAAAMPPDPEDIRLIRLAQEAADALAVPFPIDEPPLALPAPKPVASEPSPADAEPITPEVVNPHAYLRAEPDRKPDANDKLKMRFGIRRDDDAGLESRLAAEREEAAFRGSRKSQLVTGRGPARR